MLNLVVWLLVGALIGWVASRLMGSDLRQALPMNVVAGMAGATLSGWWLSPLVGISSLDEGEFSIGALGVSVFGSMLLVALANLIRRAVLR